MLSEGHAELTQERVVVPGGGRCGSSLSGPSDSARRLAQAGDGTLGRAKSRARIERGLVDMAAGDTADSPAWVYQPDEHDEEHVYDFPLSVDSSLFVRQVLQRGRLVEFGITHSILRGGKWRFVARADSCHGTVHLHRYREDGSEVGEPQVLISVFTQEDLETGYNLAEDLVDTQWEENVRRWRDGR